MNLKPTGNNVLLELDPPELRTDSGIFLTEEQSHTGCATVLAAGPGKYNERSGAFMPNDIKVGDRVMLSHFSMNKVKVGDRELTMAVPENILAIVNQE